MATEIASAMASPSRQSPPIMTSSSSSASAGAGKPVPTETVIENRIFVGGIPSHANESELRTFLTEKFNKAEIKDIKIISDRTGVSKGYGFVTFETRDMAQAILNSPDYANMIFKDRKLNISKAVKKLSTKSEHGGGGIGGVMGGSAAAAAAILQDAGHVQYVLYRRPDALGGGGGGGGGGGQLLTTLPFGYCTPVYLGSAPGSGGIGQQQLPAIFACPTNATTGAQANQAAAAAAFQWPAASIESLSAIQQAAAAAVGPSGELLYYSLPAAYAGLVSAAAAAAAAAAASQNLNGVSAAPGSATTSDYGTCSAEGTSSSLVTDPGVGSSAEGSPTAVGGKRDDGGSGCGCCCCCCDRHQGSSSQPMSLNLFGQQQQQQPRKSQQSALVAQSQDCGDLLFSGGGGGGIIHGIPQFGDLRHDFKFLDHRV